MKSIKNKPEKTLKEESIQALLKEFKKPKTVNQAIDRIFQKDVSTGKIKDRTWKYYVHLNKIPTVLERKGLITQAGLEKGPTGKLEKIWSIS